jgi:hypothetical protein
MLSFNFEIPQLQMLANDTTSENWKKYITHIHYRLMHMMTLYGYIKEFKWEWIVTMHLLHFGFDLATNVGY